MKNKLEDLTNHLYAQLERLSDESITGEDLEKELKRSEAVSKIATNIIGASQVQINAIKLLSDKKGLVKTDIPKRLLE